jgi:hypothetical protein
MPVDATTAATTPVVMPVAIAGHQYLVDLDGYSRDTIPPVRTQADTSTEAGEQSLTPQGLWRRSQESFHHGAGQPFLDGRQGDAATDPHRYRTSKGIDPWTRGQVSLLHPALQVWSTASTNLYLAVTLTPPAAGSIFDLSVADGNEVYYAALPYNLVNTIALMRGTGWTGTNCTISTSGDTFRMTATSAATISATSPTGTSGFPVDPGRRYSVAAQSLYNGGGGGAARFPNISVTWYTAAGASISTTTATSAPNNDSSPIVATQSPTAPSNAATAAITVSFTAASANGEIHQIRLVTMGPYDDVSTLGYPDNWSAHTIQAGQAAQPVQSLATDGYYVWAALGTSGLHRTYTDSVTSTADVPAAPAGGQISLVGYMAPFLLAAGSATSTTAQNTLWLVSDPLGTPALSVIKTHPNPSFVWTFISPGRNCVYAGGNSGGNGEVYKILFDPNTGALATAASLATYLPDGETIHALQFYAGGIIMGTGRGVRLGQADGAGNIDYGPLIPTSWPVLCLEPQDRYCWFGWTKYDATSSGLGRVDLGFFTDTMTPAWASDLMTSDATSGDVVAAVTFAPYGYTANQRPPVRVFTVAGKGVYIEDPTSVITSGQMETGAIRFSTSETKMTRAVDVRHHALAGTVAAEQKIDNGSYVSIGTSSVALSNGTTLSTAAAEGEAAELRFTLTRTAALTGPELTRWTLKALPLPHLDEAFTLPIIMKPRVVTDQGDGVDTPLDIVAEVAFLKGLERTRTVVSFQVAGETLTGYIDGSQQKGAFWGPDGEFLAGTYVARLVTCQ